MAVLTIQGHKFEIPTPNYVVGYQLATEGEAHTLNQTFVENVRNNAAARVKKALGDRESLPDEELTKLTQEIVEYASKYQFGVRTAGSGGTRKDPVEREALRLAKEAIAAAHYAKHGERVKGAPLNEAAERLLEVNGEEYMRRARRAIREREAAAQAILSQEAA